MGRARHVFQRGEKFYYRRRVPQRLRDAIGKEHVSRSLNTEDEAVALAKARDIDRELDHEWRSLTAAQSDNAHLRHQAIQKIAQAQSFDYLSGTELARAAPIEELLRRLAYLETVTPKGQKAGADLEAAILGLSDAPKLRTGNISDAYFALTPDFIVDKNERQAQHWKNVRLKPAREFLEVVGDKPLENLSKADLLRFREFYWARVERGEITAETANKNIHTLVAMLREIERKHELELPKMERLAFRTDDGRKRENIPLDVLRTLIQPATLEGLNSEARRLFIVCMFTGARPSEISGLDPADIHLEHETPHILIRPNRNRALKNRHSERALPLVSGALMAMTAQPNGFPRYRTVKDPTAAINKHFKKLEIIPEGVTFYGARHAFSDLLLEITRDERMRCELMGHAYRVQQSYGKGFSLAAKREVLAKLPLPKPDRV